MKQKDVADWIRRLAKLGMQLPETMVVLVLGLLALLSAPAEAGNEARSSVYLKTCDSQAAVPVRPAPYASLAGRSRLECAVLCVTDADCFLTEFDAESATCLFHRFTETNCTEEVPTQDQRPAYVQVSTDFCPNGGSLLANGQCLCPPQYEGEFCHLQAATCAEGWTSFEGSCYQFVHGNDKRWPDADIFCAALSAHLTSIETSAEYEFVKAEITDFVENTLMEPLNFEHWWTGGRRDPGLPPWNWYWEDGNETPFGWAHWQGGEPNDNGDERFISVVYWGNTGTWGFADSNDGFSGRFICEYELL